MNQEALKKLEDAIIDCIVVAGELFEDGITDESEINHKCPRVSAEVYRINRALARFRKFVEAL